MRKKSKAASKEPKLDVLEMKRILINAIKMQALYSDGKIRIFETSNLIN